MSLPGTIIGGRKKPVAACRAKPCMIFRRVCPVFLKIPGHLVGKQKDPFFKDIPRPVIFYYTGFTSEIIILDSKIPVSESQKKRFRT
jgi:hypothetical protein